MDFTGKRVLITGATRGIGKACAQAFLERGASVAINGTSDGSVAAALQSLDGSVSAAAGDVSTAQGCEAAVRAALENLGGLDVLVNNAGIFRHGPIETMTEDTWDAVMSTNVKSVQFCTKFAIPALRAAKGSIVNVASESGLNGYPLSSAYCASKGAVVNLTRSMAMELAPDIRVNALCPGVVETDMSRAGFAVDGDADEGIRRQHFAYPLQRIGTLDQTSAAILFLASDLAGFIHGAALPMEGGATVGKWE